MRTTPRRLLGEDIELVTQLASGLWDVSGDRAQLDLVLMNLAVNGQEAMPHGGTLTITTVNVADTSGLGLSTCYGVVAQQGGHIRVRTQPVGGSTFQVYLRASRPPPTP